MTEQDATFESFFLSNEMLPKIGQEVTCYKHHKKDGTLDKRFKPEKYLVTSVDVSKNGFKHTIHLAASKKKKSNN